jgi:cytochrome P450
VLAYFEKNVKEYPGISRVRLGNFHYVHVSEPAYIEHVFLNADKRYIKGRDNRNLKFLLGNGLLTNDGDFWLKQRRLMQPLFHKQRLQGFVATMAECARKLADDWEQNTSGQVTDMHSEMMKLTLDIVSRTLMSTTVSGDFKQVSEAVTTIMQGMFGRTQSLLRMPYWIPTPKHIKMWRHRKLLDELIFGIINQRRSDTGQFDDLLTMLMEVEDADTAERMTNAQLRDEVITIYLAGHETTANALTFALYLLAQHPEIKARIAEEAATLLNAKEINYDNVSRLEYTMRVIKETMRLYPPAWGILRQVGDDDVIDGWLLKKSDSVVLSPYAVHRMEKYWEDPERFDPDRFLPERMKDKPKYCYFPFGGGQRLCIGNNFALIEMQVVLAILCSRFDFKLPENFRLELEATVTLRPKKGLPLRVENLVGVES